MSLSYPFMHTHVHTESLWICRCLCPTHTHNAPPSLSLFLPLLPPSLARALSLSLPPSLPSSLPSCISPSFSLAGLFSLIRSNTQVQGRYTADGIWYAAQVAKVLCSNRYVLDWADGDPSDSFKCASDLRRTKPAANTPNDRVVLHAKEEHIRGSARAGGEGGVLLTSTSRY